MYVRMLYARSIRIFQYALFESIRISVIPKLLLLTQGHNARHHVSMNSDYYNCTVIIFE